MDLPGWELKSFAPGKRSHPERGEAEGESPAVLFA
jgi:hypothetical protein